MAEQFEDCTETEPEVIYVPAPTNALGLAGFIVSIVALFTCGCLSPISLLLSFVAVFKRPRGFAIGGLFLSLVAIGIGVAVATYVTSIGLSVRPVLSDGLEVAEAIAAYRKTHDGKAPDSFEQLGGEYLHGKSDPWGTPYEYTKSDDGVRVMLLSFGPDRIGGTSDDVHVRIEGTRAFAYIGNPPPFAP